MIDSDCCEAHLQRLVCVLQEGFAERYGVFIFRGSWKYLRSHVEERVGMDNE